MLTPIRFVFLLIGPNHLQVARLLHGLAICCICQATSTTQTTKREHLLRVVHKLLKEVLQIQCHAEEQCAAVDLAAIYHDLGTVLSMLSAVHHNKALCFFWQALSIQTEAFGTHEHPLVTETMQEIQKMDSIGARIVAAAVA
eukprot:1014242-Ditylum_brightwellii.AAC.1